jgi:MinD-like ATPase involved in chromosome partitioning or flagellar assembly
VNDELELALAASPREWALRLHRHVADHGGARVRVTVLQAADALAERFDVFVADDTTSFLTRHLVAELHALGRCVLGVYDPDDPRAKGDLLDLDVDDVIERAAAPEAFLACLQALAPRCRRDLTASGVAEAAPGTSRARTRPRGRVTAVASPSGGCGATEVAIALAAAADRRGEVTVLVDADELSPSVAQRLGVASYPNLRAAVDAVEHHHGQLGDTLVAVPHARFAVVPGLAAQDWLQLRPPEAINVVAHLAVLRQQVVVNVGPSIDDLGESGPARHALTRTLLSVADAVVAVAAPGPVGVARLLAWLADLRALAPATPVHVAFNATPRGTFRRAELTAEVSRATALASLSFLPADAAVTRASWAGTLVGRGPFRRAVSALAAQVLPHYPSAAVS